MPYGLQNPENVVKSSHQAHLTYIFQETPLKKNLHMKTTFHANYNACSVDRKKKLLVYEWVWLWFSRQQQQQQQQITQHNHSSMLCNYEKCSGTSPT